MNKLSSLIIFKIVFLSLFLFALNIGKLIAQTSNISFMIRVDPLSKISTNIHPSPVSLSLKSSYTGAALTSDANSNMFIKITSVNKTTQRIMANISNGTLPPGTILKLISSIPSLPAAFGTFGSASSTITVTTTATTFIDGIISCYSRNGVEDGYHLTFTYYPDYVNYGLIRAKSQPTTLYITFTLMANPN